jgi:cation transport ATPase
VEQYSKHPLAIAVVTAARQEKIATLSVEKIREKSGEGLKARIAGKLIEITGRKKVTDRTLPLPELVSGLECLMADLPRRSGSTMRPAKTERRPSNT